MSKEKFVGFDIGSSTLHYTVLDEDKNILFSPKPIMHFATPMNSIKQAWEEITGKFGSKNINTSFTGSGAEHFSEVIKDVTFDYDSVTIPKGASKIFPNVENIIHMGTKDSYYFNLRNINNKKIIQEWKTNSKCGGGSGTVLEKQCRRLFENEIQEKGQSGLEQMFEKAENEAEKSENPSKFLARCGVVIQSDLIHKQNEGVSRKDNLAGLFETIARNYKIDVLGNKKFENENNTIATGGVFNNSLIKKNLEDFLNTEIVIPKHYQNVAAIGAALKGIEENTNFKFEPEQLDKIKKYSRKKRKFAPPLYKSLDNVHEKNESLEKKIPQKTEVAIGIDGGSTTTKGALVDLKGNLLDKIYTKTYGDPENSLKRVINYLRKHNQNVIVRGVGATGSSRKLYEKILLNNEKSQKLETQGIKSDRVTDEITCHASGIQHYNPEIDTIFEIGGQDMKFTTFNTQTKAVNYSAMNYSCQAGSGQTLENLADIIGLDVKSSLQEQALEAERVPIIDSTCGVFMEMDVNKLISEGFSKPEISAAILRATAASYFYKFVGGSQKVGENCSAQGGPPLGRGFLASLAQVTQKDIHAHPNREMFGAWGSALEVIKNLNHESETSFRGWDIPEMEIEKSTVDCNTYLGKKSCSTRNCDLNIYSIGGENIVSGGFCPRGNSEAVTKKPKTNYVDVYYKIYNNHFQKFGSLLENLVNENQNNKKTIGIRRSSATLGSKGIWSAALFSYLGFNPVVTPPTDEKTAREGIENSATDFCVARKIVTGHAKRLNEHIENNDIDLLYNPALIEENTNHNHPLKYCIYTESEPYLLNSVIPLSENQITPILKFGDNEKISNTFKKEFQKQGFEIKKNKIKGAVEYANSAEQKFKQDLYKKGDEFLNNLNENEVGYVGIGRDYVILDPKANSDSGNMFSKIRGLNYLPQTFLEHKYENEKVNVDNEYWNQSIRILKAEEFIKKSENLYPIRMSNFGCGPDSMKHYQEEEICEGKPKLFLVTDAQTNNAPFVTRTEAFERVVENHQKQIQSK